MISRVIVFVAVLFGAAALSTATATASGNVVCAYNLNPLDFGVCVGV